MLERNVDPGSLSRCEQLLVVVEPGRHIETPTAVSEQAGANSKLAVDVHRPAEANDQFGRHRREPVPGREDPGRLVQRGGDEASVDEARPCLVVLGEGEAGFVLANSLFGRVRKPDPGRVVPAAPAGRVVMRRDSRLGYRSPPRSKCALKKLAEPAVAIAAEAEISSASVAAATICAKRYTFPGPAQSISPSHERA
jgi:hypothetical protein